MKNMIISLMGIVLLVAGIACFVSLPSVFSVNVVYPKLYAVGASPGTVNCGAQPESSPLILSVRVETGGIIEKVRIDLDRLSGAEYYDPILDSNQDADSETLMRRVYEIEGEEAYLFETGSQYKYNIYRTAVTHKTIKGTAVSTNKWQIELPTAGYRFGDFNLRVWVINEFSHSNTVTIPLRVVYDWKGPMVSAKANHQVDSPATSPGDKITIEAEVRDDLCGTFAVRLPENEAQIIFGENPNLTMTRQLNTNIWSVQNTVPAGTAPGTYGIQVAAVDRAGNETVRTLKIEVSAEIDSFQIELDKGWNLISVPKALENPAVEAVFGGTPVVSVQTVIEDQRLEPTEIEPGRGYLVKSMEEKTITLNFAEHDPSAIPLMLNLKPGWNLIGYASQSLEPMMPLTFYLGADLKDEWMVAYTESGAQARYKSTSPYIWATDSFPTITGEPYSEDEENLPVVELGKGYWIYLTDEGMLIP